MKTNKHIMNQIYKSGLNARETLKAILATYPSISRTVIRQSKVMLQ